MLLFLASLAAFVAAALLVLAASGALRRRERVRTRFAATTAAFAGPEGGLDGVDPSRLALESEARRRLRRSLQRAGFFAPAAVETYGTVRLALLVGLPVAGFVVAQAAPPNVGAVEIAAIVVALLAVAQALPKAFLARRQRQLEASYRIRFPDFLDMLVVCLNAGLSLEAALDRAGRELGREDAAFRANLDLMASEMRAGKSTGDALNALAERLGLREAKSFAALLKQTMELGTDVVQALTTYSDEMRSRRMALAEEKAAALPPKLTIPLGLFIFPVVLIAVLAPAVLRIMAVTAP